MDNRQVKVLALVTVLSVILGGVAMAASVAPELREDFQPGSPEASCAQVGDYEYAFKIDGWDDLSMNGTYIATFADGHINNITIANSDGTFFDWSATPNPIGAVIVKGGPFANVFYYDPQAFSDTGLYSPTVGSGNPAEVSHVVFCWNPEIEIEYVYETAYAFGGDHDDCFLNFAIGNWGWSNGPIGPGSYTWPLYAGAGQCDLTKGTMVGYATVVYHDGYVTATISPVEGILVDEIHVFAGTDRFPRTRRGAWTAAPGQYTNDGPFVGDIYVIVHAVVGIPVPVAP